MTPIQELTKFLYDNEYWMDDALMSKCEELLEKERDVIKKAMKHSLDEDGHNGAWVTDFINKYYDTLLDDKD